VLTANSATFTLKEFPKEIVEVYLKGGPQPATVLMRKFYPRGQSRWHDRAVAWLEKNVNRGPGFSTPGKQVVMYKAGDFGAVGARNSAKPTPGAQIVRVEAVLNDGRLLRVKDPRDLTKTYYVMSDQLIPVPAPI
jgi:hypothetical protein